MMRSLIRRRMASACALAASAWVGGAEASQVLVTGPSGDSLTQRIEREVRALGMDVVHGNDTTGCSTAAVQARAAAQETSLVLCTNGEVVLVWSTAPNGVALEEVLMPPEPETPVAVLALRAAEVARAKVAPDVGTRATARVAPSPTGSRDPLEPALGDLPQVERVSTADAQSTDPERSDGAAAPKTAPRVPSAVVSAGVGSILGGSVMRGTFTGNVELGLTRTVAPFARADLPIGDGTAQSPSAGLVALGVALPLARSSSVLIPRLNAGVGGAWVSVRTTFEDAAGATATTRRLYSPAAIVGASLSTQIGGPFRIVADALVGATASSLVMTTALGDEVVRWGKPFAALGARAELLVP